MSRSALLILTLAACGGAEAVSMRLPVVAGAGRVEPVTTDLGYTVTVEKLRVAVRDVQFTVDGQTEPASLAARAADWLVGTARAHPGHAGGGEVVGELVGDYVIDWSDDGSALGTATLLTGAYDGANFLFRTAGELDASDPLSGHSVYVVGTAERGAERWSLEITLDIDEGTALVGAPFDYLLTEADAPTVALSFATLDPFEGDTLFDGVELADLDGDDDGAISIEPGSDAHNILRRAFTRHDHYLVEAR